MSSPSQQSGARTLGPYRLLEELGRGAYGVVYRAQREGGEEVALKVLVKSEGEAARRFQREAEITARLQEPGIVRTLDVGQEGRHPYFAMELCPGPTLKDRLREGPLPPPAAAELIAKLARAVAAAHQWGVIHRDLKPSNVILDPERGPRITDFGLAKDTARERLTHTGDVLGTPVYMAPEQIAGRAIDHRIDVYALGVLLYETLSGSVPYYAADLQLLARMIEAGQAKPLRERRAEIPPDLEAICLRAMARDPDERYPTASALADALERHGARGLGQSAPAALDTLADAEEARGPRPAAASRAGWAAAGVCALGLVGSLVYASGQRAAGEAAGRAAGEEAGRSAARAELSAELSAELLAEAELQRKADVDFATQVRTLDRVAELDPERAEEVRERRAALTAERARREEVAQLLAEVERDNRGAAPPARIEPKLGRLEQLLGPDSSLPAAAGAERERELLGQRKALAEQLKGLEEQKASEGFAEFQRRCEELREEDELHPLVRREGLARLLAWLERELEHAPQAALLQVWRGLIQFRLDRREDARATWKALPEEGLHRILHDLRDSGRCSVEEVMELRRHAPRGERFRGSPGFRGGPGFGPGGPRGPRRTD